MYNIGIDFGGTGIAIGLVKGTQLMDSIWFPTGENKKPEEIVADITVNTQKLLFRNVISMENIHSIGIGVPGIANLDNGHVEYANNIGFHDTPFQELLGRALGKEVALDNDANAAAWGEYLIEGSSSSSFMLVTYGTGIGCGMIINGELYRGVNFAAGEIGHMTIRYDGRSCNCGRKGCYEAYASSAALLVQVREAMAEQPQSILWELCGQQKSNMDGRLFFEAVRRGDALAQSVRDRYVEYVAEGLINLINLLQPQELRIGGGISAASDCFLPQVIERVERAVYSRDSKKNTSIQPARAYNEAGIIGAALLNAPIRAGISRKGGF